jgi:HK97 family phage major capsid protein
MSGEVTLEDIGRFHAAAMAAVGRASRGVGRLPIYAADDDGDSLGDAFVKSRAYTDWASRFPAGGPSTAGFYSSDPMPVDGGMRTLITSASGSAGDLVANQHLGLLDTGLYRPVTVLQLLTVLKTESDLVEFAKEGHTDAAAPVAEASAITGTTGTKPEGSVTFTLVTAPVRTIAVWVPATRRAISDATELRQHIDNYLRSDVEDELQTQVLSGNGAGENFTGILNTSGVLTEATVGLSALERIRRGIRRVRVEGRSQPNAVLVHPTDAESFDTLKRNAEANNYLRSPFEGGGIRTLFDVPMVETDALSAGTALVGDFRRAILFDREQFTVSLGTVADDFIRNIVRVLGEARAAFGVVRPQAFCVVTLA